jgi:hypothetical protein
MKKPTNKALIKKLLGDTIDEAFVICAVERYCQTVLEDTDDWSNLMINKDLWRTISQTNLETIREHYK